MNSNAPSWLALERVNAIWPAVGVLAMATGSWLAIAGAVQGGTGWIGVAMPPADILAGWLMLLMVLATMAAIMVAAQAQRLMGASIGVGLAVLALVPPLILAAVGSGKLPMLVALRIVAIVTAWMMLCAALVWLLRPLGQNLAVVVTAALAVAMLAMPVVLMPLLADMAKLRNPWPLALTVNACPVLWLLDGTDQVLRFNWFWWSHARLMYEMTGLGQNTSMPVLQPWWAPTAISVVLALVMLVLAEFPIKKLFSRRNHL